jgi:hypothetical protein
LPKTRDLDDHGDMARDKIHGRNHMVGSGQMNQPERIEALETRRAQHERLTRGKPSKPFSELLDEKLKKRRQQEEGEGDEKDENEKEDEKKGAIDPHLGLVPGQSTSIANRAKGRRSGKVIVKG